MSIIMTFNKNGGFTMMKIEREKLYKEVWSEPLSKLAAKYELSDRGLAKICNRMEIPVPGIGYWRKIEVGQKLESTPLPDLSPKGLAQVIVKKRIPTQPKLVENTIEVPSELKNPHPLVNATLKEFKVCNKKEVLTFNKNGILDLRASKKNYQRGLIILDTLIKEFEKLSHKVEVVDRNGTFVTVVKIEGEEISFFLEELDEVLQKKGGNYNYIAEGRFVLQITNYSIDRYRCRYSDGVRQRVEDLLQEFISVICEWGPKAAQRRRKNEEQHKRWEERRHLESIENKKKEKIEAELSSWLHANKLREDLAALEERSKESENPVVQDWLEWGRGYADSLDPTFAIAKNLEPQIESRFKPDWREFRRW